MADDDQRPAPPGDLAQFIQEMLVQVTQGILGAQLQVEGLGARINPVGSIPNDAQRKVVHTADGGLAYVELVEFDIAVTRELGESAGAGGGIRVMGIGAGGSIENSESTTRVSRLRFTIPVVFPGDPNPEAEKLLADRREKLEQSRRQSRDNYRNWVRNW